jgi:hypothetical protein
VKWMSIAGALRISRSCGRGRHIATVMTSDHARQAAAESLDLRDDLNEEIWNDSIARGARLRLLFLPSAGGLQVMELDGCPPLPWVLTW